MEEAGIAPFPLELIRTPSTRTPSMVRNLLAGRNARRTPGTGRVELLVAPARSDARRASPFFDHRQYRRRV